jgi:hypothetical protein
MRARAVSFARGARELQQRIQRELRRDRRAHLCCADQEHAIGRPRLKYLHDSELTLAAREWPPVPPPSKLGSSTSAKPPFQLRWPRHVAMLKPIGATSPQATSNGQAGTPHINWQARHEVDSLKPERGRLLRYWAQVGILQLGWLEDARPQRSVATPGPRSPDAAAARRLGLA